jgi:hypothetical protein
MQNVILFPTSSSFFLHTGFLERMRPRAAADVAGHDGGGEGSKKP